VLSVDIVKCMYFLLEKKWHGIMKFLISLFDPAEVIKRMFKGFSDLFSA